MKNLIHLLSNTFLTLKDSRLAYQQSKPDVYKPGAEAPQSMAPEATEPGANTEATQKEAGKAIGAKKNELQQVEKGAKNWTEEKKEPTVDDFSKVTTPADLGRLIEHGKNENWKLVENQLGGVDNMWDVFKMTGAKTLYDILNLPANVVADAMKFGEGIAQGLKEDSTTWEKVTGFGSDVFRALVIAAPGLMGLRHLRAINLAAKEAEAAAAEAKETARQILRQLRKTNVLENETLGRALTEPGTLKGMPKAELTQMTDYFSEQINYYKYELSRLGQGASAEIGRFQTAIQQLEQGIANVAAAIH